MKITTMKKLNKVRKIFVKCLLVISLFGCFISFCEYQGPYYWLPLLIGVPSYGLLFIIALANGYIEGTKYYKKRKYID